MTELSQMIGGIIVLGIGLLCYKLGWIEMAVPVAMAGLGLLGFGGYKQSQKSKGGNGKPQP